MSEQYIDIPDTTPETQPQPEQPHTCRSISSWWPLWIALAFIAGLWTSWLIFRRPPMTPGQEKFHNVIETIRANYVDEVDIDSLLERTLPALVQNLDPHSAYIPAEDLNNVNSELEGSFSGIGVSFQIMNDTICVLEVISGGPSERVGLRGGDRIVRIDGEAVTGPEVTTNDVFKKLRGERGTQVKVGIMRTGSSRIWDYVITRDVVPVNSVVAAHLLDGNIGYVRIDKFARNTYEEYFATLIDLRARGAESFIIDLRGNTGGYMEPAVFMANELLPPGMGIVETRGRNPKNDLPPIGSDGTGKFTDVPTVVLIDEGSASASEIFAGAMQDNDRALIVGRRSFGKGLVQNQMELPDHSALRLTVQRYYTPSGRSIQKPYVAGHNDDYESEVYQRFNNNGEAFNGDSMKVNSALLFHTLSGRNVYGGGGIIPDVYVPNDTSGVTKYYLNVANAGLLQSYAYEYADLNRGSFRECKTAAEVLKKLPDDNTLLTSFGYFAADKGVPARWYYIKQSGKLIVNQLKALIARDILGMPAYFEVSSFTDPVVQEAVSQIRAGHAATPITQGQ